jgi:hypothetical protein
MVTAIVIFLLFLLYMLPIKIADWRKHPDYAPLMFIDLLWGWTAIGWVYCLLWSLGFVRSEPSKRRLRN